jgi:translation initiation factor IF-2
LSAWGNHSPEPPVGQTRVKESQLAVRIYSLAKELKLDSKVLVDICTDAGVTGKGSALASLTDEEVDRVRAFISGGAGAKAAPKRPAATGTVEPAAEPAVVRREDYVSPAGAADKLPMLDKNRKKSNGSEVPKPAGPKLAPKPTGPKFAPLPSVQQPSLESTVQEPAPQKPDLRLPADALRGNRSGSKPLSEHLRKHEQKRKDSVEEVVRPGKSELPLGLPGRDRGRRGAAAEAPPDAATREKPKRGGKVGEGTTDLLGDREQRQLSRKRLTGDGARHRTRDEEGGETAPVRRRGLTRNRRTTGANTAAPRKGKLTLDLPCTVRSFSETLGVPAQQVLRALMNMGTMATINAAMEPEIAELLAVEMGVEVDFHRESTLAEKQISAISAREDDPSELVTRPPVITFLGHVDHGKTSLLDKIIGIDVASRESGGITQHIRAYQIEKDGRRIAFVDTPGHEAFTEMRARGANVTDIAVLVVAADDGLMPQTEEAISHARAAGVPIVVALNKIDLPGVDVQRIYQQLAATGLLPTEWGGDTEVLKTSALTGAGLDDLLETLLTIAELHDFKANPARPALGTCLEAEMHEGRGVVAKLMVQNGTLRVGDAVVCGGAFGRIKAMHDTLRPHVTYREAGPSTPVNATGLDVAPSAGDHFYVVEEIAMARQIAAETAGRSRLATLGSGGATHVTLETLFDRLGESEVSTLNMILRADTRGSIEAIQKELSKLEHPEVKIKILQAMVGGISEADVHLADASDAVIIGFNVVPDEGGRILADRLGVQVRRYDIIYKLTEDIRAALEGMLKPDQREITQGRALVQRTFVISRIGTIAGCRVLSGVIQRNSRGRLIRDNRIIGDYPLESLRREKDDAREVREGLECGIRLGGFNDLKEGDIIEVYKIEEVARTFS